MHKKGFTLVEVALFLALSGLLVAVVIGGTSSSIAQKRYNDTVNSFESYLEGLYSSANYVSHSGTGKTNEAVYGKLVEMYQDSGKTKFTSYTVLGRANPTSSSTDALETLYGNSPRIEPGSDSTYIPSWGGVIKSADTTPEKISLLIIRHPKNGMFFTYVNKDPFAITYHETNSFTGVIVCNMLLHSCNFKKENANFCIESGDMWAAGNERRLIRIHEGANNSSGVEIVSNTDKGDLCS